MRDEQLLIKIKLLCYMTSPQARQPVTSYTFPVPLVYPVSRTVRMFVIEFAAKASARKVGWYFQKQPK